jgi:predicted MFS family arabinose efflux permease
MSINGGIKMTRKNIIILRIISAVFGMSNILGFVWFGEFYDLRPVTSILFEMSTGIVLLMFSLMPSFLLKNMIIRIFIIVLIIIGSANCIYKMTRQWNLINGPDYGAIIIQIIILCVMIAILCNIFRTSKDSNKSDA